MFRDADGQNGFVSVRLVFGLLIVALGTIFLADNLGLVEGRDLLRRFWPAAFCAVGIALLLQPGRGQSRWWGLVWVVAGLWIYADQQDLVRVDFWHVFIPCVLLFVGGTLVWRTIAGPRAAPAAAGAPDDTVHLFALMAGNEVRSVARAFRGGDLAAVMGGVTLDLTQAQMEGDTAVLDVVAFWGGIEIRVPRDWTVTSTVFPLMGGFEDNTKPVAEAPAKRLLIRGVAVMGGVEVKS